MMYTAFMQEANGKHILGLQLIAIIIVTRLSSRLDNGKPLIYMGHKLGPKSSFNHADMYAST